MDRRTKGLLAAFGLLGLLGFLDRWVYPSWIAPMLTLDQRISERQAEYDKLVAVEERVRAAKRRYRDLVVRVGSFDAGKVETDLRDRLNQLIDKHHLEDTKVSRTRPARVGKTDITRFRVVVAAVGPLQSAVEFLKDVTELPQLLRVQNVKILPVGASRRRRGPPRMKLTVPIEAWVLPQQRLVGRIEESALTPPDALVRHLDRDYAPIWKGEPFSEYVPPVPLRADAGRDVNAKPGRKRVVLTGSASGGDGRYTFLWEPAEGLSDPHRAKTRVDVSKPFTRTYTLTVTDEAGKTATDTVKVAVAEPPQPDKTKLARGPVKPKPKPVDPRWKNRKYMQLRMTFSSRTDRKRVDEVMVYDNRKKKEAYYAVGDEFDGGELVFVHPTGGLVRRMDEYFIYPIGVWLDDDISAGDAAASGYPELIRAAEWFRRREHDEEQSQTGEHPGAAAGAVAATPVKIGRTKDDPRSSTGKRVTKGAKLTPTDPKATPPVPLRRPKPGAAVKPPLHRGPVHSIEPRRKPRTPKPSKAPRPEDKTESP